MPQDMALNGYARASTADAPSVGITAAPRAAISPDHVKFQLIEDITGFIALEDDWNELFERSAKPTNIFQSFEWNRHWCSIYLPAARPSKRLAILTARTAGRLVLVLPLVTERHMGVKLIKWMGDPVSQYGDVLVDDLPDAQAVIETAWLELTRRVRPDAAWLRFIRADSVVCPLLRRQGFRLDEPRCAPYVDLTGLKDAETFLKKFGSKARKNRRRLARRLAEQARTTVQIDSIGPGAARRTAAALELKRDWLSSRRTFSHAFSDHRIDAFFQAIATQGALHAAPVIATISANEQPIAAAIGFSCKHHMMLHILAYSGEYARYGVGVQVFEEMLRESIATGHTRLDLLAPASDFKSTWTNTSVEVADYTRPMTLKGRLYSSLIIETLRPIARAIASCRSRSNTK